MKIHSARFDGLNSLMPRTAQKFQGEKDEALSRPSVGAVQAWGNDIAGPETDLSRASDDIFAAALRQADQDATADAEGSSWLGPAFRRMANALHH